jgi:hypothetical protein
MIVEGMPISLVSATAISSLLLWQWCGIQEAKPVLLLALILVTLRTLFDFTRHRNAWANFVFTVRAYSEADDHSHVLRIRSFGDI